MEMKSNNKKTKNLLIAGAGHIGQTIAAIFSTSNDYAITLVDQHPIDMTALSNSNVIFEQCDVNNKNELTRIVQNKNIHGIISSLPYFCNEQVATIAKETHCHYFDLTEDIDTTRKIFLLAKDAKTAFIPQCGVAPGFINVIANELIQKKLATQNKITDVKLYCGALPQKNDNFLGYMLTWSTEGLINEYGNDCRILENGKPKNVPGLSQLESLQLNETDFEAFCTSGGVGTLIDTYQNQAKNISYKTMRYPGHCEKMRMLMYDLKLNEDRSTLKRLLENALPKNGKDMVVVHVAVDDLHSTHWFYPTKIAHMNCSAIQAVTSTSAAVIIDIVMSNPERYAGGIKQESFSIDDLLNNTYSGYLKQ